MGNQLEIWGAVKMFLKYLEQGLSPIQVNKHGKNPIATGWTKYCYEKPSQEQAEEWDSKKEQYNIGIACGPASNIICVDIDTDDPAFMALCPPSPVRRRGKKGEARFFKYNPNIKSQSFPNLDILSDGRQVLVPPSVHPETKQPYVWLTQDTLENMSADDLPELEASFLSKIMPFASSVKITNEGRNNRLKSMVCAMRGRGEVESKIVTEIYEWDLLYNKPRLFTDQTERFKADDEEAAKNNAWKFVSRITQSLIESGVAILDSPGEVVIIDESQIIEDEVLESNYFQDYPEPTGIIKHIKDLILSVSERHMPNLALGGAVALMSVICANRFRFNECWTNLYVLNLAPTGSGKSFPQNIIVKILQEKLRSDLLGFGGYTSNSAFIKNLKSRRERLDVVDEISGLFSQMKNGNIYSQAIIEEMCKLWSSSGGYFNAIEYVEREDASSCFNPCVSILGSSTNLGLKEKLSKEMVTKGLLPRFLIFSHENYGKLNPDPKIDSVLLDTVVDELKNILRIPKNESREKDLLHGPIYDPIDVAPGRNDAIEYFRDLRIEFSNRIEFEKSEPIKNMLTRGKEQVMKLATIHAVGNGRMQIEIPDLAWAKKIFDVGVHNMTPMVEESSAENFIEKDTTKVFNFLKKNKKKVVTKSVLYRNHRAIEPKRLDGIISRLLIEGKIIASETSNKSGPKSTGWTIC